MPVDPKVAPAAAPPVPTPAKTPPRHELVDVWVAAGLNQPGPANVRTAFGEVAGQVSIVANGDASAPPMALIVDTGELRHLIPWHAVRSVTQIGADDG